MDLVENDEITRIKRSLSWVQLSDALKIDKLIHKEWFRHKIT